MRAHIVLPDDLIQEVDGLVGPRQRSKFVAEAVREKLRRERVRRAFDEVAGSLAQNEIPGWESPAAAVDWVRSLRREGDRRLAGDPAP
jgi:hypothetical protein